MESSSDRLQYPKNHIFVEPATKAVRPYLVEYVSELISAAKELPRSSLLGGEGQEIAMDITGALVWQDAKGIENDGWFNEKDEPVLSAMLNAAGTLDADANHPEKWRELFELASRLR